MRDRRLRPPETPQGAPCGSLPDLNKLVIPKNTSRPSSAKSAQVKSALEIVIFLRKQNFAKANVQ